MAYQSIDEIILRFNLGSTDKQIIRDDLNQMRAAIHPDKNGGQFKSKEDETLYTSLNEAIEFIDSINNSQVLVPVKEVTDLIKAVTQLIPNNKTNFIEQEIRDQINSSVSNYTRQLFFPRLGLSAITAIVSFTFLFPKTVSEHPILKKLIEGREVVFSIIWLYFLVYTLSYWYITFSREERLKRILSNLKTENLQNVIFERFIESENFHRNGHNNFNDSSIFSKSDLIQFIRGYFSRGRLIRYDPSNLVRRQVSEILSILWPSKSIIVDSDLAESVAQSIISRAESKDIVTKKDVKQKMGDFYKIVEVKS